MDSPKAKITDKQLILACQKDDQQAFRQLVQRYQTTAFRFAFRLNCNSEEAEDLCQHAFLKLWNYRRNIRPEATFSTLLYTVVSRLWIDHGRSGKRNLSWKRIRPSDPDLVDAQASPESITINQDLAQRIRNLSRHLPPRQKLVFTLRDLEDMTINEVVEITGLSTASVKTNLCKARQKIRKQLHHLMGQSK